MRRAVIRFGADRRSLLHAFLLLVVLAGAWELYVDVGGGNSLVLPAPHQIAVALYQDRSLLWSNFLVTAEEVLLGVLFAVVAALALATAMHFSRIVRSSVYPLLIASQTIPIPLMAPILVLWLGFGLEPKLIVVGLVSFFSIVVTTLAGFASVDPELTKLMRTFGASRWRLFVSVELRWALPGVFTGARLAVIFAVLGAVLAEEAGANSGLGYVFTQSVAQLLTARAFATVVILSAFAILLFAGIGLIQRIALPWSRQPIGSELEPR